MTEHDVVVIGGSLAGAACIRELERLQMDAVAFERDRFPRDKVCGGFLSPGAVSCLEEIGILNEVRERGAVPIHAARIRVESAVSEVAFKRPGLGISRATLDDIAAARPQIRQGCAVTQVERNADRFIVRGPSFEVSCRIVVDAAGKLSRFTRRRTTNEFGLQYYSDDRRDGVLDFSFFRDGYGGSVSVEGNRSNCCFLMKKEKLEPYLHQSDKLVTGPLAYDSLPSDYIAIGDAAGMVDPFCGEGMRHALQTGIVAARIAARGLRYGKTYDQIRLDYDDERQRLWSRRRTMALGIRSIWNATRITAKINNRVLGAFCRLWMRYSE